MYTFPTDILPTPRGPRGGSPGGFSPWLGFREHSYVQPFKLRLGLYHLKNLQWQNFLRKNVRPKNIAVSYILLKNFTFPAFQVLTPLGKTGDVDVSVKLAGYDQKVLDAAQITNPVRP